MSIASDLRSYADNAVTQGKQVLDSTVATAQAQLNDVTGQANEFYGKTRENVVELATKATGVVSDLRVQAEKAVNLDAIKTAVEPYVLQVKGYVSPVTERVESLIAGVKSDKRVATLVDTAQERVVKPVQNLTARGSKPAAKPVAKSTAAKPAAKPAATKPASKPAAAKPAARKAPARRATTR